MILFHVFNHFSLSGSLGLIEVPGLVLGLVPGLVPGPLPFSSSSAFLWFLTFLEREKPDKMI